MLHIVLQQGGFHPKRNQTLHALDEAFVHDGGLTVYYSSGLVQMISQGEGCLEHTVQWKMVDLYFN